MDDTSSRRTVDGRRIGEKPNRPLPELEQKIKLSMAEALNRTVHLRDLQIADISKVHKGWRSSHLAGIRGLRTEEFGFQSLLFACEKLDVTPVCHFIPSADLTYDGEFGQLFKILHSAGKACETAAPNIGTRSYPLAAVSCQTAGLTCYLAIDAIRRSQVFARREVPGFCSQLRSTVEMLQRVTGAAPSVKYAIKRIGDAVQALEDYALDTDKSAISHSAGSHAAA